MSIKKSTIRPSVYITLKSIKFSTILCKQYITRGFSARELNVPQSKVRFGTFRMCRWFGSHSAAWWGLLDCHVVWSGLLSLSLSHMPTWVKRAASLPVSLYLFTHWIRKIRQVHIPVHLTLLVQLTHVCPHEWSSLCLCLSSHTEDEKYAKSTLS